MVALRKEPKIRKHHPSKHSPQYFQLTGQQVKKPENLKFNIPSQWNFRKVKMKRMHPKFLRFISQRQLFTDVEIIQLYLITPAEDVYPEEKKHFKE